MLDIRLVREQPDFVRTRLALREGGDEGKIQELLEIDDLRRKAETALQALNAERKKLSKEIGGKKARGEETAATEDRVRKIGEEIALLNERAAAAEIEQRDLLLQIPNLPNASVPVGKDASANPVLREWGTKPALFAGALDHVALGAKHKLFDSERAAKLSGSGFICFTGAGARLERALIQFMLDLHTREHGYLEMSPPFLVRRDAMIGTTQLPKFEEDMYGLENGEPLPRADGGSASDEFSSRRNFTRRRAAEEICRLHAVFSARGLLAGRETRGIIRVHQFDKVELVKLTIPEQSGLEHEALTADAEKVLQLLGLHYRVIELCTGDLGFGSAKTYDLEVWSPGQNAYLEVSSCSNFEDFQARRMNLRFKDAEAKNRFCHTLNGSGLALPRLFAALIESYQTSAGAIMIPEKLQPYFGANEIR